MLINKINATPTTPQSPLPTNNNKKVAFGANPLNALFKLDRSGTMSHNLFITNAFIFLLGTRLFTSRDKDENREILIRDIPSIIIAVVGVDTIQKAATKGIQKLSGFAIAKKPKERISDSISYAQTNDLYIYDKNLDKASGIYGFAKRLDSKEGNLEKICSKLNDSIKSKVSGLDNTQILNKIKSDNTFANELKKAFSNPKNKALKYAETFKTLPTVIGFAATLSILGFVLPKLNIAITEHIAKKREQAKLDNKNKQIQA